MKKSKKVIQEKIMIFLKGILMGICDVIPGISGGTIAFITGIYERLINAVKAFSPQLVMSLFTYIAKRDKKNLNELKKNFLKQDLGFLIVLGAGIGTAILLGARFLEYLLENYFVYTISFFMGLIIASSIIIFENIEKNHHHLKNVAFGLIGLIIGIILVFIVPAKIEPSLLYIFMAGFFAISAMFLPGLSGAFILLILGVYEFMLSVLHHIKEKFSYFLVFGVGAAAGAMVISRVISFLFKKDKNKTLYFLLGLVLGCLSIPIKRIITINPLWTTSTAAITIAFLAFGFISVNIVKKIEKSMK
jgi:putative membrane protein